MEIAPMCAVAVIHTDYKEKFGIPRQSGLVPEALGRVVFEPPYRSDDALRGLDGFSHLWLIWEFSRAVRGEWSPTVRPPRLGGNVRMGVFATRSPFRPNPIGLSVVKLVEIRHGTPEGTVLIVSGADLLDGTPILDIKPYVPYSDSIPDALGGFASEAPDPKLKVVFPDALLDKVPNEKRAALKSVLALDPRPRYQNDPDRIYGFRYSEQEIRFRVQDGSLTVLAVEAVPASETGSDA